MDMRFIQRLQAFGLIHHYADKMAVKVARHEVKAIAQAQFRGDGVAVLYHAPSAAHLLQLNLRLRKDVHLEIVRRLEEHGFRPYDL